MQTLEIPQPTTKGFLSEIFPLVSAHIRWTVTTTSTQRLNGDVHFFSTSRDGWTCNNHIVYEEFHTQNKRHLRSTSYSSRFKSNIIYNSLLMYMAPFFLLLRYALDSKECSLIVIFDIQTFIVSTKLSYGSLALLFRRHFSVLFLLFYRYCGGLLQSARCACITENRESL